MNLKSFMVVLMFLALFAVLANGMMSNTDLTSNTPFSDASSSGAPSPLLSGSAGACKSVYVVQTGDTLSNIATRCGLQVMDILAANPSIQNANQISVGQQIALPAALTPGQAAVDVATRIPTVAAPKTDALAAGAKPAPSITPTTPGAQVTISFHNLPLNAAVLIKTKIGDGLYYPYKIIRTADSNTLDLEMSVPMEINSGALWVVSAFNSDQPSVEVDTVTFRVDAAGK